MAGAIARGLVARKHPPFTRKAKRAAAASAAATAANVRGDAAEDPAPGSKPRCGEARQGAFREPRSRKTNKKVDIGGEAKAGWGKEGV